MVFAEQTLSSIPVQTLDTIQVQAHPLVQTAADFAVADHVVDQKALSERTTTIGDALADELGFIPISLAAVPAVPLFVVRMAHA